MGEMVWIEPGARIVLDGMPFDVAEIRFREPSTYVLYTRLAMHPYVPLVLGLDLSKITGMFIDADLFLSNVFVGPPVMNN